MFDIGQVQDYPHAARTKNQHAARALFGGIEFENEIEQTGSHEAQQSQNGRREIQLSISASSDLALVIFLQRIGMRMHNNTIIFDENDRVLRRFVDVINALAIEIEFNLMVRSSQG